MSWYPRRKAWEDSGFNVCHWNRDCEDFYLHRRADILAGKAVPLSGNAWRQKIRMTQHARTLMYKMNKEALEFLKSSQGISLINSS